MIRVLRNDPPPPAAQRETAQQIRERWQREDAAKFEQQRAADRARLVDPAPGYELREAREIELFKD